VDWVEAIVYGLVQGLTEYLPVSSSAHLAMVPWIFGWKPPSFAFDVLVQLGTLGAVCLYLREDLKKILVALLQGIRAGKPFADPWSRKGWLIVVATLPSIFIGLALKDMVEDSFTDPRTVLTELFLTGLLLFCAEALARTRGTTQTGAPVTWSRSIVIGFAQAVAILPGISRSGSTIAGAMLVGVSREEAGRFSFLMSIPVMLGAGVLGMKDLVSDRSALQAEGPGLAIAFVVAALVGFAVIRWFLGYLKNHSLYGFATYCCVVSLVGLAVLSSSP